MPDPTIPELAAWCRETASRSGALPDVRSGEHYVERNRLIHNLRAIAAALERAERLEALADTTQRDLARATADDAHNCRLLLRLRDRLALIVWAVADEGDRVYFGSTNDADDLRDIARALDDVRWDRILRGAEKPDLYAELRKLRNDLGEAERERDEMRAENARLREALERIRFEASGPRELYERNGPTWTGKDGHEYTDMGAFLAKCDAIEEIAVSALTPPAEKEADR